MTTVLGLAALPLALGVTPYLIVCHTRRQPDIYHTIAWTALVSVLLNAFLCVALHALNVRISAASLACCHTGLALIAWVLARARRIELGLSLGGAGLFPLLIMLLFGILALPITPLAGIDTYRWQCLATSVRVEGCIPWMVHPVSLLGFTPRAYPSAHPLLLATVQVLGGLGVEWGFFIVSLFTGLAGTASAFVFGSRLMGSQRGAVWFSLLYVLSPVFMRYGHWATGRGLFLAFFPLFLSYVCARPRPATVAAALATALVLALSHKVGLIALPLVLLSLASSLLVTGRLPRLTVALISLAVAAAALAIAPPLVLPGIAGHPFGCIRQTATRFGVMLPLCVALVLLDPPWLLRAAFRRFLPVAVLSFAAAHHAEMYGAMVALPFVAAPAAAGALALSRQWPARWPGTRILIGTLALLGAVAIVSHRCLGATPRFVRRAAQFIERHDPEGPHLVEAPGRARYQIHAYVSGCPRFSINAADSHDVRVASLPRLHGSPSDVVRSLITWLRGILSVQDLDVAWYGDIKRTYYVAIDGVGEAPAGATLLMRDSRISIHAVEAPP